jgi:hypothetical protein
MYASDCLSVVITTENTWPSVRVCPLIPLILADYPGSLAREITELAAWLAIVYDNNSLGTQEPWLAAAAASENLFAGAVSLPNMDTYKIPLPRSLGELAPIGSMIYCPISSRLMTLKGLPKDTPGDLVKTLINNVHRDF